MDTKKGDSHYWARRSSSYKAEQSSDNSPMTPEEEVAGKLTNEILISI